MENLEASAVWHPALRSDDIDHVAATSPSDSIEATHVSLPPSIPTIDPVASNDVYSPELEDTAPVEDTEVSPPSVEHHSVQAETRDESLDETSKHDVEEASTAVGDRHVVAVDALEHDSATDHSLQPPEEENHAAEVVPPPEMHEETLNSTPNAVQGAGAYSDDPWAIHDQPGDLPTPVNGEIGGTNHDFWGSPKSVDDGEDDFFDQLKTQTKPIYVPPEAESRFEEGLPLLDDSVDSPTEPPANQGSQLDTVFAGDEDEDDGFFKVPPKPAPENDEQVLFHIKRKSTSQVMDSSLHVSQDSLDSPLSPTAEEFNDILAAAASEPDGNTKEASVDDLAARWEAELSDDEPVGAPTEDDLAARWEAELDDDDLLLEDEATQDAQVAEEPASRPVNGDSSGDVPPGLRSPFGTPQSSSRAKLPQSAYTPHQPSTSDLLQGIPAQGALATTSAPYATDYFHPRPEPPVSMTKAESFAERSKEGYVSPYDLPDDITQRRRPVHKPVVAPISSIPAPPPRSSSMPEPPLKSSSPASTLHMGPTSPPKAAVSSPPKNFYEDLPLPPQRPRSRPASSGRYTPNASAAAPPITQPPPPTQPAVISQSYPPNDITAHSQLQQPERLGPYTNTLAPTASGVPVVPSATSRYSPKPPTLQPGVKPPASPRYSPVPPPSTAPPPLNRYVSQPTGIPGQGVSLPFQPRTSSPLAYHEKVSYQHPELPQQQPLSPPSTHGPPVAEHDGRTDIDAIHPPPPANHPSTIGADSHVENAANHQHSSPPRNPYAPQSYVQEFSRRLSHTSTSPSAYPPPTDESPPFPLRRSLTQSPTQQKPGPRLSVPSIDPFIRPASVHGSGSPTRAANPYAPAQGSSHTRAISQSLEFIPPTDGQELDPLERWKGAPIVKFGFGGAIVSSFPKHIPRYSAGQVAPKIKSSPGEVKIIQLRDWISAPESIVQHPGPLKNKSKKKDLIAWLSSKIAAFENEGVPERPQSYPDSSKRHEEKLLLWKVVRVLVEHDGGLQVSPELQQSLRAVIFPNLHIDESDPTYGNGIESYETSQPPEASSHSDAADSKSLHSIRNSLLMGDREKAVWNAADSRLWGHALIIASTLDKSIWKQVVQEFVRREVRSTSGNAESLAALYEIFAGNIEESIDELVPPSARAGLQMVNKIDGHGTSKNALAGLESWRDTLGMVLSNRSPEDQQALLALGRLLLSYGRIEAAHICLIFSRAAVFGGPDDPQTNIVLLGTDHVHSSAAALHDDDAILLTEAYEFATSVLAGSPTSTLPHLPAFKLIHAWSLADRGRSSEAQQYCDAIAVALKASAKPSGYHNQHLFFGVDDLSARLRQSTGDAGSSWISRPSMEKVSSSMWNKFSNFVAGDDSDAVSTGSGKAGDGDIGPFAKISGTPTVSRSPSVTDIYGSLPMTAAQPIPSGGPSRYQPNNQYAPNSSPDQGRGRSSLDSQRSASFGLPYGQRRGSQEYPPPVDNSIHQGTPFYGSPSAGYQFTPPQASYMPLSRVEEDMATQSYAESSPAPPQGLFGSDSAYQPLASNSFSQVIEGDLPATSHLEETGGYMPPGGSTGYEPPSAVGNTSLEAEADEESEDEKPQRNKSAMDDEDDDDDLVARADALKKAERARNDRAAEEAFRKAAEADAKKPPPAKNNSWWFSGWVRRGSKENDNAGGGPIRAKLGEENSFYYDKELKKWVNKKDPNSATQTHATPPPPKGPAPPSRSASGSSMPPPPLPSGPGSRPQSSAGAPPPLPASPVPSSLGLPPPSFGFAQRSVSTGAMSTGTANSSRPGSSAGPPPRPATSLSNASSIDDLLGAPQARKGNTARGRKKGRGYVDVMAK